MRKLNQLLATFVAAVVLLLSMSNPGFAQATQVTYYHVNSQGTPVAASDGAGSPKWSQEYSNFGYHEPNVDQINDTNESNFGLAGHVEDQHDDLLLVYMQARYYDPLMGRFLSIDPAGFDEVNPQSFNRYAYANNNPHRYVDPDGNIIFLAPFVYAAATFIAKEVAVAVVSHYVPAVQYLGVRGSIKGGLRYAKNKLGKGVTKGAGKGITNPNVAKLAKPARPAGMTQSQFGKNVIGWGGRPQGALDRMTSINPSSVAKMKEQGLTREMAKEWSNFYSNEFSRNANNATAANRVQLMEKILNNF